MCDLSIIVPAAPGRYDRIESIFKRLKLNKSRRGQINFELVLVDNSKNQEYQKLARHYEMYYTVKYISLPFSHPYPNPSYMRNVGFRIATGEIFTMIDADHWVSEDFIEGVLEPFYDKPENVTGLPAFVLNTGFMIDTSKGNAGENVTRVNDSLIAGSDFMTFADAMATCGIRGPVESNRVWLASYPAETFLAINGYDERYVTGYSREDDDIYYRLASRLPIHAGSYSTFAGVHLWHPQGARNQDLNTLNRKYYDSINPADAVRNKDHEWGKMIIGGFSIIQCEKRSFVEHEKWIEKQNIVSAYIKSQPWFNFEAIGSKFA